jgi:hypothetical protein
MVYSLCSKLVACKAFVISRLNTAIRLGYDYISEITL